MVFQTQVRAAQKLASSLEELRTFVEGDVLFLRSRCAAPGGLKQWLHQRRNQEHTRWYNWMHYNEARVREDAEHRPVLEQLEQFVRGAQASTPQKRGRREGDGSLGGGSTGGDPSGLEMICRQHHPFLFHNMTTISQHHHPGPNDQPHFISSCYYYLPVPPFME